MSCCTPRDKPDSDIPFEQMGCPCDTWTHLKDMFVYLKDERAGVVPCKPSEFTVQWSFLDPMNYMFTVTDVLTNDVVSYSVEKDFTKESPLAAFERDWRQRELMYNRGIISGLSDLLEAMEDLNPDIEYKLSRHVPDRYVIHKPLSADLGVVVFEVNYAVTLHTTPVTKEDFATTFPDNTIEFPPELISDVAYGTNVLVRRFRKIGVRWDSLVHERIKDFNRFTVKGVCYRDDYSMTTVTISYQDMDLTDPELLTYHQYYTDKGPQNGYYHCC